MDDHDLLDPLAFGEQIKGVQDFFATIKDEASRFPADRAEYTDTKDFAQRLDQDLRSYIKRLSSGDARAVQKSVTAHSNAELVPKTYLRRLMADVSRVELLGLDFQESITNGLPQVYVPAVTNPEREAELREGETEVRFRDQRRELVLHRLGETSLYLPGDLQESLPDCLVGRLPVLIRLRDFWGQMDCKENQGEWSRPEIEAALRIR